MALSDLKPLISGCIKGGCSKFYLTDSTGIYNAVTNTGGWQNAVTILASDVTAIVLSITKPDGTVMDDVDLLSQLPDPVTGTIEYNSIDLVTPLDGLYTFSYKINVGDLQIVKTGTIYSTCNVRCCVSKMWDKYAQDLITGEDCGCANSKTDIRSMAELGESMLNALESGAICNNTNLRNAILEKLQKLCKLVDCGCK